ncbi:MAG: hypothetical protein IKI03_06510 [Clostridia bacterium]|nr:hypothetical protein [Clostridia bacterium]
MKKLILKIPKSYPVIRITALITTLLIITVFSSGCIFKNKISSECIGIWTNTLPEYDNHGSYSYVVVEKDVQYLIYISMDDLIKYIKENPEKIKDGQSLYETITSYKFLPEDYNTSKAGNGFSTMIEFHLSSSNVYMSAVAGGMVFDLSGSIQEGGINVLNYKLSDNTSLIPYMQSVYESALSSRTIPESNVIDEFSRINYTYGIWTISYGELIRKTIKNYQIKVYGPEDSETKNFVSSEGLRGNSDYKNYIDNSYLVVVSGDVMLNPEVGEYFTEYNDNAIKILVVFNGDNELYGQYGYVSTQVQTSIAVTFSNSY